MSLYILDSNILSDMLKPQPTPGLGAWMERQDQDELYVASLSLAEIARGIRQMPDGRKRRELDRWFSGPSGPPKGFAGRILPFDEKAALVWADIMADGHRRGTPRSPMDMIIAATALANGCSVVTLNERHFRGVVGLVGPTDFPTG